MMANKITKINSSTITAPKTPPTTSATAVSVPSGVVPLDTVVEGATLIMLAVNTMLILAVDNMPLLDILGVVFGVKGIPGVGVGDISPLDKILVELLVI